jgi:uncharacterized protein YfaS (alpha-2-macroglobulin family)
MMNERRLPKRVLIVHQGSRKTYTLPFEFDKSTGTAIGKFIIPKDASLGRYTIYLSNKDQLPQNETEENDPFDWTAQETGHFVVSEYRLPLMKTAIKIQGEPLVRPSEVTYFPGPVGDVCCFAAISALRVSNAAVVAFN